jgi:FkbM family methyltransferase
MIPTTILTMVDGVKVVVPDSLDLITPYVLREQHDWFEDEIKFLRRLLQPGQKAIDIGANYGVYTLSMSRTVGETGCVWAFEPASNTANLLIESVAVNGFTRVTIVQSAVSNTRGMAQLTVNQNSELNALVHGEPLTCKSETVPLVTLDDCMEIYDWKDIDFVKIDAEGEEINILKGGKLFFSRLSPLVQYDVKEGDNLHLELVQSFANLGYDSYRLVPGLDLLVRFDAGSLQDGFLLNLFCCKPDRACELAARGFLLNSYADPICIEKKQFKFTSDKIRTLNEYDWHNNLTKLPYGAKLANLWERTVAASHRGEVDEALSIYFLSRDSSLSATERFSALESSFSRLKKICESQPSNLRLSSLARVTRDYGARSLAVNALAQLSNTIFRSKRVDLNEPFLAPGESFDFIPPGDALGNWVLSAVLEELERLGSYSSFYTGISARQRLEIIRDLGFASAEMQRRLNLLDQRFGLSSPSWSAFSGNP